MVSMGCKKLYFVACFPALTELKCKIKIFRCSPKKVFVDFRWKTKKNLCNFCVIKC